MPREQEALRAYYSVDLDGVVSVGHERGPGGLPGPLARPEVWAPR